VAGAEEEDSVEDAVVIEKAGIEEGAVEMAAVVEADQGTGHVETVVMITLLGETRVTNVNSLVLMEEAVVVEAAEEVDLEEDVEEEAVVEVVVVEEAVVDIRIDTRDEIGLIRHSYILSPILSHSVLIIYPLQLTVSMTAKDRKFYKYSDLVNCRWLIFVFCR